MARISYKRYRFPPAVIQYAGWLYFRFTLGLRDLEEMKAQRGVDVSYETIRYWTAKCGPQSTSSEQRFRETHAAVYNMFNIERRLLSRRAMRILRARSESVWSGAVACQGQPLRKLFEHARR